MKRLLLVLVALAPSLVLLGWVLGQGEGDLGRWQRLNGGGDVRVRGVTFGDVHEMENDRRSLLRRAQDWWKGPRPKGGPSPFALRKVKYSRGHALHLWIELRRIPKDALPHGLGTLHLAGGETIPSLDQRTWTDESGRTLVSLRFPFVPYRDADLNFTLRIKGEDLVFALSNPAAKKPLPVWTAQPLPQTIKSGGVDLTLRGLHVEATATGHISAWEVKPDWEVTVDGQAAANWYSMRYKFEDPGGNSSPWSGLFAEPVWRVRAVLEGNRHRPVAGEEVRWMGTIDPTTRHSGTGLPLDDAIRIRGVAFAGVLPAGTHGFDRSGVLHSPPNLRLHHVFGIERPSLVVVAPRTPIFVWRGPDGSIRPADASPAAGGGSRLWLVPLPAVPTAFGIADEKTLTLDFYVAAPEQPKLELSASQASVVK